MTRRIRVARFRNSLAFRVILSTVLLCLAVVWLTGSALYAQLSDGIRKVTVESSVAETRSAIFNAQYRIVVASESNAHAIKQIVDDVVINSSSVIGTSIIGREVALLRTGPKLPGSINYQRTSNGMLISSIPLELRKRVAKSISTEWSETTIRYSLGGSVPALAVGEKITIPDSGAYEMYLLFSLVSQNATLDLLARSLLFTGLALVLLIALIAWLVVRQVVRPVREAARIAEGFTAGHLEQRMQVKGNDEIARLGNSFNEMALSLQSQITRLENLSSVQQRFVSDVSHELRTPLTTLRMASEVIHSAREQFDPTIARSAELLVAQIDRFERLLEDLLEVSRFDAEVAVLECVEFDMVMLVEKCIEDLGLLAKERNISIESIHEEGQVLLQADTRRVERILRNLLSNAIEYSNQTPITVRIVASESEVAVGVRDFGSGLDEESAYRVFDRFWREDPSRARVRGGTGLGLSIALEDARLHNGELEVWGRPGKGAHFVLTLPRWSNGVVESRPIRLQPDDSPSTGS